MKFFSTNNPQHAVNARQAVLQGLAPDGGLYMPEELPEVIKKIGTSLPTLSLIEIGFEISKPFLSPELSSAKLSEVVSKALTFNAPLVRIKPGLYSLELYHGPTLAFKDFGARFMAQVVSQFVQQQDKELVVLVATSGDTGSAVAQGFYNAEGVKVVLLYPSGQVSEIQEQQLTTVGGNVTALEVKGTFDDCQKLVKTAFVDSELAKKVQLASANSINIARLLPQSFYYCYAVGQLNANPSQPSFQTVFSVPSGNFGNLTAGLFAKRMGLPVKRFIAATNANDIVPKFLENGVFNPQPSKQTISNAMDVGNPSNFVRMQALYQNNLSRMQEDIIGMSFSDSETREGIKKIYHDSGYVLDPHGAVAYKALEKSDYNTATTAGILLETAHPAKFAETVADAIEAEVPIPAQLAACLSKQKQSTLIPAEYSALKSFLLDL